MYEIGITAHFEAAHQLIGDFGPATRIHGHTYRLEVIARGPHLQADGTLFDISKLQSAVDALVARLHYRNLNEIAELAGINTTAEQVASFVWEQIVPIVRTGAITTLTVRVWENPGAYAAREDAV